ncbi:NADH dehydrogenase [ubiquinone] 1 beta subcomplex subunit 8, mitochondrial-like [Rhopilema esculentum]|uniref:NADH dehydrogenase [ubiquinone] 1 beta subcomplex subunit 8, mitochondrial-like n=1 Tax=Rhopilema esculentum TaxID=499914 RepID=UPI0031DDDCDD|eukprot:gene5227-371_t
MASALARIAVRNVALPRRVLGATTQMISRLGSTAPPTPPVTPVSGPDWEDKGWKNDGMGIGDYPNLPEHSQQLRNPYLTYWDQQDRRNFGEPLHEEDDAIGMWMPDRHDESTTTVAEACRNLAIAFGLLGFVYYLSTFYNEENSSEVVPRMYPFNNLYLENGGDPNADPSTQPVKRITKSVYGY